MLELRLEIVCHTPALQIYQPKQGDLEKQRYLSFYGGSCKWQSKDNKWFKKSSLKLTYDIFHFLFV